MNSLDARVLPSLLCHWKWKDMKTGLLSSLLSLSLLLLPLGANAAVSQKDVEKVFVQAQTAFEENRLDDAARDFSTAAEAFVSLKEADKARAVYANVAIIRIKQERWQEAYDTYDKALALPGRIDPAFFIKATGGMALGAEKLQRRDLQAKAIERLLASKVAIDPPNLLNFLSMQGDAYRATERYALACQSYEKALALKNVPQEKKATLLVGLGLAQSNLGRYAKAQDSLAQALKIAIALQQPMTIAEATSNIGVIYWEMGLYEKALEYLEKALALENEHQLRRNQGVDSNNVGLVYKSAGNLTEAIARIDSAIAIAREVRNRRDEAIALSNRALLFRMKGDNAAARENYAKALEMCRQAGFTECEASALMGLAKMDRVVDKNYGAALEKLTAATAIYEKLENPGFLAESSVQLGMLYQKIATPHYKTRDLVFENEEPQGVSLSSRDALIKSREYFAKAKTLAEMTGRKEMIWSSLHGLAFVERENKNLQAALDYYSQAIDMVLSMKGSEENADLLLEFLRDKDDLFAEAMGVCVALYEQTKDPALLKKQMEYDEIYRNEVMRTHQRLASLSYADPQKKALYDEIIQLTSTKQKAEAAVRRVAREKAPEAAAEKKAASEEATLAVKKFEGKLKQWKSRYPNDAALFDSIASINLDDLRAGLAPDQAIVQYIPLEDSLVILTATKEEVNMTKVGVSYEALAHLIRDEFIAENIENFGYGNFDEKTEKTYYEEMQEQLHQLYKYLYAPVAEQLKDKPRLYVVTSKYLSYVPFAALIMEKRKEGNPHFLIEDKTITLSRLSFIRQTLGTASSAQADIGNIVAVGDPQHDILEVVLDRLDGASAEVKKAVDAVNKRTPRTTATMMSGSDAKKSAWHKSVTDSRYSIFYFATHAVPYAEIKSDSGKIQSRVKRARNDGHSTLNKKPIELYENFISFYEKNFPNNSHLNGFLFMAYPDDAGNGLLTLKDIQELPDPIFEKASLAVLSACNTAVSYSPRVIAKETIRDELETEEASKELVEAGWTPGVDQICLVDTFMKKNFRNVYGTLWSADDTASSIIMSRFMNNLGDMPPASALREAQLHYLRNLPPTEGFSDYPQHPYFWACGNMFGQ
ncbi:MAG: CHAT domain-containing protein [Azoarcus sp.]|nr:CHAT domain-containing protein [Azoarcus sp.]